MVSHAITIGTVPSERKEFVTRASAGHPQIFGHTLGNEFTYDSLFGSVAP